MNKIIGIAINEYDDLGLNSIENCINDLNRLLSVLSSRYKFDDIELLSRREQTTSRFMYDTLYEQLINAMPEDNILIIYAGHGEFNSTLQTSYWQPSDADLKSSFTWFNLDNLLTFIKASPASPIALISDSCFSGTIFEAASRGGGASAFESKTSRLALTSGSNEKVSDGGKNSLSPFATALVTLLETNTESDLPFTMLSNQLLKSFDSSRKQTPMFGSLVNSGHKGGSLVLRLKEEKYKGQKRPIKHRDVNIPLNLSLPYKLTYECVIPFFEENDYFDHQFINNFIQHIAYTTVAEARGFLHEEHENLQNHNAETGYELSINYKITFLSEKCLSIAISVYNYFGGAHPNYSTHTLNFSFAPDRHLSLYDILDYSGYPNLEGYIKALVEEFGDPSEDIKESILSHLENVRAHRLDFNIYPDKIVLSLVNDLPHVIKAAGDIEIPLSKLKFQFDFDIREI